MNRHFGLRLINLFGAKLRTHIHLLTAYNISRTAYDRPICPLSDL